jgi:hypothetical protein
MLNLMSSAVFTYRSSLLFILYYNTVIVNSYYDEHIVNYSYGRNCTLFYTRLVTNGFLKIILLCALVISYVSHGFFTR